MTFKRLNMKQSKEGTYHILDIKEKRKRTGKGRSVIGKEEERGNC
jgi:hypothetical protein